MHHKIQVPVVQKQEEDRPQKTVDQKIIEEFEKELATARREADEHWDKYVRAMAEMENVRKRLERTYEQRIQEGKRELLRRFLEVADNLERALSLARHHGQAGDGLQEGVEITYRGLQKLLAQEGVEAIKAVGHPFDPRLHEAVEVVLSDEPEDTVVAEVQKGYLYRGQLLRPAKVRVAKPASR
ncbi:MAG: nucleotide exchange factor GrpE [Anaerolineae bacterium]